MEGAAHLVLADGVVPLRPAEAVFEAMLAGWERQQRARLLATSTIRTRVDLVRRFAVFTGTSPWEWVAGDVEDWATELLSAPDALTRSTVRNYLNQIAMFCDYITDTRYGWAERCLEYFGTHPVQSCHEDNMPSHSAPYEGRPEVRALTRRELQDFFDYADEQVVRIRAAGRKGWVPAFRDATVFKVLYGWGLRRREAAQLDLADFSRNPKAPEFGRYGACYVKFGKAVKGSPPRRRTVLTVWEWHLNGSPLQPGTASRARAGLAATSRFLTHLRRRGRTLANCRQADLDAWLASSRLANSTRVFWSRAIKTRNMPFLEIPTRIMAEPSQFTPDDHRWAQARRLLNEDALPVADQVAALLVLLFAHQVSRIARLTRGHVHHRDDGRTELSLGTTNVVLSGPLAELINRLPTRAAMALPATSTTEPGYFPVAGPASPSTPPVWPAASLSLASTPVRIATVPCSTTLASSRHPPSADFSDLLREPSIGGRRSPAVDGPATANQPDAEGRQASIRIRTRAPTSGRDWNVCWPSGPRWRTAGCPG